MPKSSKPTIGRVVEPVITPGVPDFIKEGREITSAKPGTLLLLTGHGFGKDPEKVVVSFASKVVEVLPAPLFSSTQVLVSVPQMPGGQVPLKVTVAGEDSNAKQFRIEREPTRPLPAGTTIRKLLTRCDAFAVLFANEIRIADMGAFVTPAFREQLVEMALGTRKGILLARQKLEDLERVGERMIEMMEVKDAQEQERLRRVGSRVAQRLLLLLDEAIESSYIVPSLEEVNARLRRGGSRQAAKAAEIAAIAAEQLYHLLEAAQSAAASVGVSEGILVDAEEFPAEALMATLAMAAAVLALAAKLTAAFTKNEVEKEFEDEVKRKFEELEQKLDKLEEKSDKEERKLDQIEEKLDAVESKLDSIETKLDEIEPKLDQLEGKADKSETKLDYVEEKLDIDEIKKDQIESKLDVLEPKVDYIESKLDKLEGKADYAEDKLDKLEDKADKAEGKLDKLEDKADYAEDKLDQMEDKLDKLEDKADKAENKLDKLEPKIDNLEPKLDKLEPKLDNLEPKIDLIEPKLDEIQSNQDRNKEFWQFSPETWSVRQAKRAGVRLLASSHLASPTTQAFSVESIHVLAPGSKVTKIIVDDISTDVSASSIITPSNVLIDAGIPLIGASHSVEIEFDDPYTGPIEFNGEKPQGLDMCTVVKGAGSSQSSPNPCT